MKPIFLALYFMVCFSQQSFAQSCPILFGSPKATQSVVQDSSATKSTWTKFKQKVALTSMALKPLGALLTPKTIERISKLDPNKDTDLLIYFLSQENFNFFKKHAPLSLFNARSIKHVKRFIEQTESKLAQQDITYMDYQKISIQIMELLEVVNRLEEERGSSTQGPLALLPSIREHYLEQIERDFKEGLLHIQTVRVTDEEVFVTTNNVVFEGLVSQRTDADGDLLSPKEYWEHDFDNHNGDIRRERRALLNSGLYSDWIYTKNLFLSKVPKNKRRKLILEIFDVEHESEGRMEVVNFLDIILDPQVSPEDLEFELSAGPLLDDLAYRNRAALLRYHDSLRPH